MSVVGRAFGLSSKCQFCSRLRLNTLTDCYKFVYECSFFFGQSMYIFTGFLFLIFNNKNGGHSGFFNVSVFLLPVCGGTVCRIKRNNNVYQVEHFISYNNRLSDFPHLLR